MRSALLGSNIRRGEEPRMDHTSSGRTLKGLEYHKNVVHFSLRFYIEAPRDVALYFPDEAERSRYLSAPDASRNPSVSGDLSIVQAQEKDSGLSASLPIPGKLAFEVARVEERPSVAERVTDRQTELNAYLAASGQLAQGTMVTREWLRHIWRRNVLSPLIGIHEILNRLLLD